MNDDGTGSAPVSPTVQRATNVLLVEDDPLTAFNTARALRQSANVGIVMVASDGLEAFEMLRSGTLPPGALLVLTDLSMPRMSGLELAAAIRNDPTLKDQPVVVLTTSVERSDREAAAALGVRAFFRKPHLTEFLAWLAVFCGSHAADAISPANDP